MENFNQIFILIAEKEGISFNSDILETGLVNIILLIAVLVLNGQSLLGESLEERRTTIVNNVQDAENRLIEAEKRFAEAKKQLNQANVIINEIKNETITTKTLMLESDISNAKKELKIRFDRALATFKSKERQIFLDIKQQIISLVLDQTVIKAKKSFGPRRNALALIDETIKKVGKESL